MTKKLLTLILIAIITLALTPGTVWHTVSGGSLSDTGTDIIIVDDHIFITGYTRSFGGTGYNTIIGKLTLDGTLVWLNAYGIGGDDIALSLVHDTGTNTLWAAGFTTAYGSRSMYAVQIQTDGTLLQQLILDPGVAEKIIQTDDGLVLAGWHAPDVYSIYPVITKIDRDGNTLWTITGENQGRAYDICKTANGLLAVGYKDTDTVSLPWVMQIDQQNNITEQVFPSRDDWFTEIQSIDKTEDNIIFGITSWNDTQIQTIVLKTDLNLNETWTTYLDDLIYGSDVKVFPDESIAVGSSDRTVRNGDATLVQLNKDGLEINRYTMGGEIEDWINNIAVLPDGRCMFTGLTYSWGSPADRDIYTGMVQFEIEKSPGKNPAIFEKRQSGNGNSGGGCFIQVMWSSQV